MQLIPTNGVVPAPAPRYIDYPDQILKDLTKITVVGGGVVVTLASCVYGPQVVVATCMRQLSTRVVPFIQRNAQAIFTGGVLAAMYAGIEYFYQDPLLAHHHLPQGGLQRIEYQPGQEARGEHEVAGGAEVPEHEKYVIINQNR